MSLYLYYLKGFTKKNTQKFNSMIFEIRFFLAEIFNFSPLKEEKKMHHETSTGRPIYFALTSTSKRTTSKRPSLDISVALSSRRIDG